MGGDVNIGISKENLGLVHVIFLCLQPCFGGSHVLVALA